MKYHIAVAILISCTIGCSGKKGPEEEAPPPPSKEVARGQDILKSVGGKAAEHYKSVCSTCHGISGMGDGAQAKGMMPGPRDFTDAAWQAKATDEDIRNIIVKGGSAMTPPMSALMMPAPKEIANDPETLDALVKIVRLYGPPRRTAPIEKPKPAVPTPSPETEGKTTGAQRDAPTPNAPRTRTPKETANHIYRTECSYCHGPEGAGDGPTAVTLTVKPRSFRSKGWQDKVTDQRIQKAIVDGGESLGLSPEMPAHTALKTQPVVLAELVQVIRSMKAY